VGRGGFTLVEVMLVLVLMVVIAAMAWPAIQRPFANRRLNVAADVVRSELSQARVDAMRSGHTFTFRYAPESDRFCKALDNDSLGGDLTDIEAEITGSSDEEGLGSMDDVPTQPVEKMLPEGVRFVATENPAEGAAASDTPESQADLTDGWSEPIFFYPDGTTSDARLTLANERGCAVELILRGVTGTIAVSDIIAVRE
jgi:prepilin-type N-terminal cleavage/methylation domain-containing protein